ncbi:MAG: TonB C-terminal domain-containing protein [Sulfurimonas sp.]
MAFGVYFLIIGLLIFYFNSKTRQESKHYVKKNEDRIRVSLAAPEKKKSGKPKRKQQKKSSAKPKPKPKKKVTAKKPKPTKKVIKEKVVKKVKPKVKKPEPKRVPPKKVNKPKSLFDSVSSSKPKERIKEKEKPAEAKPKLDIIKTKEKVSASELVSSSLKIDKSSDRGIENEYLAKIEEKLQGWPAQSEYAGEKARVALVIEPSGMFTFRIISASNIPEFNQGLEVYLKQLQRLGFGPHKGERAYELDVEFIAKE